MFHHLAMCQSSNLFINQWKQKDFIHSQRVWDVSPSTYQSCTKATYQGVSPHFKVLKFPIKINDSGILYIYILIVAAATNKKFYSSHIRLVAMTTEVIHHIDLYFYVKHFLNNMVVSFMT